MIESIYIKNFGIVDETEFRPAAGFSVITGETGAGKSMIMGAVALLMGQRFSGLSFPNPNQKAILELSLLVDLELITDFLSDYEIESVSPLIIRREINSTGRSRCFINDSPVPINALKEVVGSLIDLSEQHENLSLSRHDARINLVDSFAANHDLLLDYQSSFRNRNAILSEINSLTEDLNKILAEQDYFLFQMDELQKLNYQLDEVSELESELNILEHAEVIKQSLFSALQLTNSDDNSLITNLEQVIQSLKSASNHHKIVQNLSNRLREIYFELKDINAELESEFENVEFDQNRLGEVEARLTLIYKLINKHNLSNANDLLELKEGFSAKLQSSDHIKNRLESLKMELVDVERVFYKNAKSLTDSRVKVKNSLEFEILEILKQLAMPDAQFVIQIDTSGNYNELGCDNIDLLFSANKGVEPQLLSKVASGGELSRLMLSIKSVLGKKMHLPTMIFDEIDTGISGETATKVGLIMSNLAIHSQLIVISHLPQIAAKANQHFLVEKVISEHQTRTQIREINFDERVEVIATMLSGNKDSTNAKLTAQEMLKEA